MKTDQYDFVIIGGGTSGLVVATRLSEDPAQRILVLEAGSNSTSDPRVSTPGLYAALWGTDMNWGFETVPQANLNGRPVSVHQGKVLGGSSAINAQVLVPPAENVIDSWGVLGNEGWNWASMKKYFRRPFDFPKLDDNEATRRMLGVEKWAPFDNASGPVQISFPGDLEEPFRTAWAEGFREMGLSMLPNPYGGASVGAFSHVVTMDPVTKERSYSVSAYYNPVKHRENLEVVTGALVDKILFDRTQGTPKATGVRYKLGGETKIVYATKEVILAAGALQSPKILELSGIGSAAILSKLGVEVVQDLPGVGENLQDHLLCGISYEARDEIETLDGLVRQEPEALKRAVEEYQTRKSGPLAWTGIASTAYVPSATDDNRREELKRLIEEHRPVPGTTTATTPAKEAFYDVRCRALLDPAMPSATLSTLLSQAPFPVDETTDSPVGPVAGKWITFLCFLSDPLSRGSTHVHSADPTSAPTLDPAYLSHPIDRAVFARHLRHLDKIAEAPAFDSVLKRPLRRRDPASEIGGGSDCSAAERFAAASSISMWHLGGTCAMLPREKGGVLDTRLRVHGVDNLRVVDASAVPVVSTGNMQQTVYAVAERAADLIKEDFRF